MSENERNNALAEEFARLVEERRREVFKASGRAIMFLGPLFVLVAAGWLAMAGFEIIDPFHWVLGLFLAVVFGWWFGARPLEKTKKVYDQAMSEVVKELKERIEE